MNLLAFEAVDPDPVPVEPDPASCMIRVAILALSVMLAPWPVPAESNRLGRLSESVPYSFGRPSAVIFKAESISDRFPATLPFIEMVSLSGGRSWSRLIGVVV